MCALFYEPKRLSFYEVGLWKGGLFESTYLGLMR